MNSATFPIKDFYYLVGSLLIRVVYFPFYAWILNDDNIVYCWGL
jgi:hypothetical protein